MFCPKCGYKRTEADNRSTSKSLCPECKTSYLSFFNSERGHTRLSKVESSLKGIKGFNELQNKICAIGIIFAVILIIFPPWIASAPNGMSGAIGHYLVFSSSPSLEWKFPSVDYGRLFLEELGVIMITFVLIFIKRDND